MPISHLHHLSIILMAKYAKISQLNVLFWIWSIVLFPEQKVFKYTVH